MLDLTQGVSTGLHTVRQTGRGAMPWSLPVADRLLTFEEHTANGVIRKPVRIRRGPATVRGPVIRPVRPARTEDHLRDKPLEDAASAATTGKVSEAASSQETDSVRARTARPSREGSGVPASRLPCPYARFQAVGTAPRSPDNHGKDGFSVAVIRRSE
ncbi:hypothetical protein BH23GEM8_BH23GEM8_02510 [soil metagenome]